MDLRSYTKQELALLYFPDSDPDVARAHLMRWIVRCTQLYEQLLKSGISPLQRPHYFTSSYTYLFSKKVILLSFLG